MCTGYEIKFYNWKAILPEWSLADYPTLVFERLADANRVAEKLLNEFVTRIENAGIQFDSWINEEGTEFESVSDAEYEYLDSGYVPNAELFDGEAVVEERVYHGGKYSHHNYICGYLWVEEVESSPYEF